MTILRGFIIQYNTTNLPSFAFAPNTPQELRSLRLSLLSLWRVRGSISLICARVIFFLFLNISFHKPVFYFTIFHFPNDLVNRSRSLMTYLFGAFNRDWICTRWQSIKSTIIEGGSKSRGPKSIKSWEWSMVTVELNRRPVYTLRRVRDDIFRLRHVQWGFSTAIIATTESSFHTTYAMYKVHATGTSLRALFFSYYYLGSAQDSIQETAIADGR